MACKLGMELQTLGTTQPSDNRRSMCPQARYRSCLWSSSPVAAVPHTMIPSPRPQPGKFIFSDPKRVLQHYLPASDIARKDTRVGATLLGLFAFVFLDFGGTIKLVCQNSPAS